MSPLKGQARHRNGRLRHLVRCSGFSLVELLVVIAIIGLLINLLLPAVQQARESARRIQCASNLKQVALAVQSYETAHKKLPAAGILADPEEAVYFTWYLRVDMRSGTNYSWIVSILPYLEEQALYDQFDFSLPVTRNPSEPQQSQPPSLICPSDGATGRFFEMAEQSSSRLVRFGKTNIAAFASAFHVDSYEAYGAFPPYGLELKQIIDGTSKTLAFAEIRTREHIHDQRGAWALPWSGSSLLAFDMHPLQWDRPGRDEVPYEPDPRSLGATQPPNGNWPDVLYECPEKQAALLEGLPCDDVWEGYISAAPRSVHPGGANSAFLDGHIEFLPDDIDEFAMVYMVHIRDGEQGR
jgi:prepilin-type N-terminal cleavage/methylation domain-containing protein/prepilin-type processing-associated H-X9-DG protein